MRIAKESTRSRKGSSSQSSEPPPSPLVRVGLVESDPLRAIGCQWAFERSRRIAIVLTTIAALLQDRTITIGILARHRGEIIEEVQTLIRGARPDLKLLIIGVRYEDAEIFAVLRNGAWGYLDEAASLRTLRCAVSAVSQGLVWAPLRLRTRLLKSPLTADDPLVAGRRSNFHITPREQEVLDLLVGGRPNSEIAALLGIGKQAVKGHLTRLMRKAGVENRTALALFEQRQVRLRGETG